MSVSRKLEILRTVEASPLPTREALARLDVTPSTYYRWRRAYRAGGELGLKDKPTRSGRPWNRLLAEEREQIFEMLRLLMTRYMMMSKITLLTRL